MGYSPWGYEESDMTEQTRIFHGVFRIFYVEVHVICKQSFTSSFPIWISFISFSSLIAVARISKTMLNTSDETGHPCIIPDFRGNAFNFLPLRIMFAVSLSHMAFIMLRYVPSSCQHPLDQ